MKQSIHLIGNAHLDPAWLWRWQEGYAEIKATFKSALDRIKTYPDFVFTCSSAAFYEWVLNNNPVMFEEIVESVADGQWVIVGGMWVQPDCNIPSGESFVRHTLYSQQFFYQHFNHIARTGYNVDSFGHNGGLPQILAKSGLKHYVYMRPSIAEKESLQDYIFNWSSIDGSHVLAYRIPTHYGHLYEVQEKVEVERQKIEASINFAKDLQQPVMNFYGVGNHGGGPTIENIEMIHRLQSNGKTEELVFSDPDTFFHSIRDQQVFYPWVEEELQHHARGCYSANSEVKALNRKAEQRLLEAEKITNLSHMLYGSDSQTYDFSHGWKKVLFNQFHDILAGCSIREVYDDARDSYGEALNIGACAMNHHAQKISWGVNTTIGDVNTSDKSHDWILWGSEEGGTPVIVFNPHSFDTVLPVQINWSVEAVKDYKGRDIPSQPYRTSYSLGEMRYGTVFQDEVPAFGYKLYWLKKPKGFLKNHALNEGIEDLENNLVHVTFNSETGYIDHYYDKVNDIDLLKGNSAVPRVIDIEPYDTWGHYTDSFRNEVGQFLYQSATLIEKGPVRTSLKVVYTYGHSELIQTYTLYDNSPNLDVQVSLNFQEKHKMLKLSFDVHTDHQEVFAEIPYGIAKRQADGQEEPMQRWVAVVEEQDDLLTGLGMITSSKYSYDCLDNQLRLTVANSSLYADHIGIRDGLGTYLDQGHQTFTYHMFPITKDSWRSDITKYAEVINTEPLHVMETYHDGPLPPMVKSIYSNNDAIHVTAFKRSEDLKGYVLRLYETSGYKQSLQLRLPLINRTLQCNFQPHELITYYISDDPRIEPRTTSLIELDL